MYRLVEVKFNVYVPEEIVREVTTDKDAVVDYLNEKMENDPEFFYRAFIQRIIEIDTACLQITDEIIDGDLP